MQVSDTFEMVRRAIDVGRPAHGYLIVGSVRGAGMELALRILQHLFCQAESGRPCGVCDRCRRIVARTESDVHWVFPEKKSRIISAEQVREKLINEVTQTSLSGGWKAGVLVGADRLNEASANAFLKTLEEPPEKTLFLLLSDTPQQLLPTIVSRCQRIDLNTQRELAEPWRSRVVETLSSPLWNGPVERLAMANLLFAVLNDMRDRAEVLVKEESVAGSVAVEEDDDVFDARVSARYREMRTDFLLTMSRWFRDLFVLKAEGDESLVFNRGKVETLRARAGRLTLAQALYNLTAMEELSRQMERNLSEETMLAYALDRMNHGAV